MLGLWPSLKKAKALGLLEVKEGVVFNRHSVVL